MGPPGMGTPVFRMKLRKSSTIFFTLYDCSVNVLE